MFAKVRNLEFLFFLLFLSFQIKALPVWGFSFLETDASKRTYLEQAKSKKLWLDPTWIRLGHYEKKIFGNYESSFRGFLFIDPDGYRSPEKEMTATLKAFFSPSPDLTAKFTRHPQCQFLARRRFLAERLHISTEHLLPCEERKAWKKSLNVQAVSLIFAASDLSNPASSFGHTFLKLINPDNANKKDLIDYGVNYAASADQSEGVFYALKGLLGFYNGFFTMLPYHQKIREYINIEGRDIWEYPLAFSASEVDFLVDHLLELEQTSAPYFFFSENCSYHLLKTLEVIHPELNFGNILTSFVIPIDTVKVVRRYSNLSKSRVFKKSLKTDYLSSYSRLGLLQKKALAETVDKLLIPSNYELSKIEKAEVFEAAMKYIAIKSYRTGKDLDHEVYTLSSERASLGNLTSEEASLAAEPPDESHDSSAIYLGYGLTSASSDEGSPQKPYYSFKFRPAFHDLEQPDFGAVPMSQTEIASLTIHYEPDQKRTRIQNFTFFNLINTQPVTPLDKSMSWKLRAEVTDSFKIDTEASGGFSFDSKFLSATRAAYLITGRYWQDTTHSYPAAGPEVLLILRLTSGLAISTSWTYFLIPNHQDFLRTQFKFNYNLQKNKDIRLEVETLINQSSELQIKFVNNFLF